MKILVPFICYAGEVVVPVAMVPRVDHSELRLAFFTALGANAKWAQALPKGSPINDDKALLSSHARHLVEMDIGLRVGLPPWPQRGPNIQLGLEDPCMLKELGTKSLDSFRRGEEVTMVVDKPITVIEHYQQKLAEELQQAVPAVLHRMCSNATIMDHVLNPTLERHASHARGAAQVGPIGPVVVVVAKLRHVLLAGVDLIAGVNVTPAVT